MATSKQSSPSKRSVIRSRGDLTELELAKLASNLDPNDYHVLGFKLGFKKAQLNRFKHDNPANIEGAMSTMLINWQKAQTGSDFEIRRRLAEALKDIERTDLAESVFEEYKDSGAPQLACSIHPSVEAAAFCERCKKTACIGCVTKIHNKPPCTCTEVKEHQTELQERFDEKLKNIKEIRRRVDVLKRQHVKSDFDACTLATELEESIKLSFSDAMDALVNEKSRLLNEVRSIKSARSGEIWNSVSSQLTNCESTLNGEDAVAGYYGNVDKCEKVLETIEKLDHSSLVGGVLATISDLCVQFVPNPNISFGRLHEATGWYLAKKIDLPEDKVSKMNACTALSGRRVAVGYSNGGVDVIGIDDEQRERILSDIHVHSLSQMRSGMLLISDASRKTTIRACALTDGCTESHVIATLRESSKPRCVTTDLHDNIYVGFAEFKEIEMLDKTGRFVKKIKCSLELWFISAMRNGNIAVSEAMRGIKDAVHVMTPDGKVMCTIPGRDGHAPRLALDQHDQVYVAMNTKDGMTDIRKYSSQGELLEVVTEKLQTTTEPREWIQLSCVSPSELVMCDVKSLFVFRKRPTLSEIINITA